MRQQTVWMLVAAILLAACDSTTTGTAASRDADTAQGVITAVSVAEPLPDAVACPAQTFTEFLKHYAGDERIRDTFTMPTVSVVDFRNPDEPTEGTKILNVPKRQYEGFYLTHREDGFHVVDSAGGVDPTPVDISVEQSGADGFLVSYQYGMSEGGSYLFRKQGNCWALFGEPNPSSP